MAGIADIEPRGVNAGLAAQPLVTSGQPAQPEAVNALINSFRNGVITADDIIERIGETHQQERAARGVAAKEFQAQNAVDARAAALQAATDRANLESQQAAASAPLIQPQAELAAQDIKRKKADQIYGQGIAAYQQYSPLFGAPGVVTSPDGTPDYDAMGAEGNHMLSVLSQRSYAQQMLQPEGAPQTITDQNGTYTRKLNKAGEDVSEGSPQWKYYRSVLAQPLRSKLVPNAAAGEPSPGATAPATPQPSVSRPPAAAPSGPVIEPKTIGEARAKLLTDGFASGSQIANMDANEVITALQSMAPGQAQVAPTGSADIIQPATPASPAVGTYEPGVGTKTGAGSGQEITAKIMDQLHKNRAYEVWDNQKNFKGAFQEAVKQINAVPIEDQRSGKVPMNSHDIALAESIIKLYDPQGAIREFKWDKLAEAQPYVERMKNWAAEIQNTGNLTPESRQRLIEMGNHIIKGTEDSVRSKIKLAGERAQAYGVDPKLVLDDEDNRVLSGQGDSTSHNTATPATPTVSKSGPVVNIPGVGAVYLGADGQYHRAQ